MSDEQSFGNWILGAEVSFTELVRMRMDIDREIKVRANEELAKLEAARSHLLGILSSDRIKIVGADVPAKAPTAPPKYRDPATGKTWSGKGKRPGWFDARRTEDFLIDRE